VTAAVSQAWRASTGCAGLGPSLFFSEQAADITEAKQLCSRCAVAAECASASRRNREPFGVWGGEEHGDGCGSVNAVVGMSDQRLVELFASANPRSRAIDVLHRVDVSTTSAYRYLARALQLGLVERRGRSLYPAPRR
jgi:hypothetical protein